MGDGVEVEGVQEGLCAQASASDNTRCTKTSTDLGVGVYLEPADGSIKSRDLGDVVVLALTLLLLQLEGDAADRAALDTLHQVGRESGNLVAETLRGNDGDFIDDPLVGVEVESETGVAGPSKSASSFPTLPTRTIPRNRYRLQSILSSILLDLSTVAEEI